MNYAVIIKYVDSNYVGIGDREDYEVFEVEYKHSKDECEDYIKEYKDYNDCQTILNIRVIQIKRLSTEGCYD